MTATTTPGAARCDHEHGTMYRYGARICHPPCRCPPCRAAATTYRQAHRSGAGRRVAVGPIREHLLAARAVTGATWPELARRAALTEQTLRRIAGLTETTGAMVHRYTAEAILGLPLHPCRVTAIGTHRRIRALARAGHNLEALSRSRNYASGWLARLLRADTVSAAHAAAVHELYEAHSSDVGTSEVTARRAERARWPGPDAWTPQTLDDAQARPRQVTDRRRPRTDVDWARVWQLVNHRQPADATTAELREAVRQLTGTPDPLTPGEPYSAVRIGAMLGVRERTVIRFRRELGILQAGAVRPPRPDQGVYLNRLIRAYTARRGRDQQTLVRADARTALADLRIAAMLHFDEADLANLDRNGYTADHPAARPGTPPVPQRAEAVA